MKHVNKWPLALYVCMNSIFKCFIGNRIEWSHIEWHFFSNWQVLLIQTSPCYCLLGSIYLLVKMYARGGRKYFSISGRSWALRCKQSVPSQGPLPLHLSHQEEGESDSFQRESNAWRKLGSQGSSPAQYPCTASGECAHLSLPGHVAVQGHTCVGPRVHRGARALKSCR